MALDPQEVGGSSPPSGITVETRPRWRSSTFVMGRTYDFVHATASKKEAKHQAAELLMKELLPGGYLCSAVKNSIERYPSAMTYDLQANTMLFILLDFFWYGILFGRLNSKLWRGYLVPAELYEEFLDKEAARLLEESLANASDDRSKMVSLNIVFTDIYKNYF